MARPQEIKDSVDKVFRLSREDYEYIVGIAETTEQSRARVLRDIIRTHRSFFSQRLDQSTSKTEVTQEPITI